MTTPTRNLVLVYQPSFMGGGDLETIAEKVRSRAPDIEVYVVADGKPSFAVRKKAAKLPTFVLSIGPLASFRPKRGKIYSGKMLSKIEQLQRLQAAGAPVPQWRIIKRNVKFDPKEWGDMVVVKPTARNSSAQGRGVQFVKTEGVKFVAPEEFPDKHVGQYGPMMIQRFIDSGEYPNEFRVLCLFGVPLYAVNHICERPNPPPYERYQLDDPMDLATSRRVKKFGFGVRASETKFVDDPVLLQTAALTFKAIPEAPLHGVDLVRDKEIGKYYVMEANPLGLTWHFSSYFAGVRKPEFQGMRREDQVGAFSIAADLLVERTRTQAE